MSNIEKAMSLANCLGASIELDSVFNNENPQICSLFIKGQLIAAAKGKNIEDAASLLVHRFSNAIKIATGENL